MKVIIDRCNLVSSYQPGHSHSDILSFECSLNLIRLIVNSGISTYENNYERHLNRVQFPILVLSLIKLIQLKFGHPFELGVELI